MEEMFFCPSCMAKAAPVDGKCPVCGHDVNIENAPHQLPVNTILNGRYIIGRVLGAGGFGITYIGYDLKLDGKVAVKEYDPSGAANRSSSLTVFPTTEVKGNPFEIGKTRFLKEARTLSEFVGEGNIVALRDYFEEYGTAYIVMEYLEGEDLSHYAKEHGVFAIDEALDLLEPAMLALDKIHKKGLIHRDISPSNIMVLTDGRVKVLDFGSARLQNASGELSLSVMLKPGYAPMEQYSTHGEQGSWTDVYAMSATIYKLITGKTPPASTDRLMEDTLVPPSKLGAKLTPAQERALLRGLALRPANRTQTMAELAEGLRGKKKASPPKPAKPPKPPKPPRPDKNENPVKEQEKKEKAPKPPKPAVELKKKTAPEKPAKPVKAAQENKKAEKPALPRKRLLIIAAALLAVLTLCLTVPKAINIAGEKKAEEARNTHLAELAAAREAIARHRETTISTSYDFAAAVRTTGTVVAVGSNYYGQRNVSDWIDIVAISAGRGHTVGLKPDGTVVAVGDNASGQCDIGDWTDIVAVSAGSDHTVGLKADGTVVAVGSNYYGQRNVSDWTDIRLPEGGSTEPTLAEQETPLSAAELAAARAAIAPYNQSVISAGREHTAALRADGTAAAVGSSDIGQCDVSGWSGLIAVSAGWDHTVGLRSDGTAVAVGSNYYGQCDVRNWSDIAAVSAGAGHTVGLKSDGTVLAAGDNRYNQSDVSGWVNIIAISAGGFYTVGLKADGTVLSAGDIDYDGDLTDWTDIVAVSAGLTHTVGLKKDGTVVAVGSNDCGQCDVSDWRDIIAVSAAGTHTIGLKADGTVIAVGDNNFDVCAVDGWHDIVAISTADETTMGLRSNGAVVIAGINFAEAPDWTDIALPE